MLAAMSNLARPISILLALAIASALASTATADDERFRTDRKQPKTLALPDEDDAFSFIVYGDRTGGPAKGIEVLAQAVSDTNLLDPDLVMTVGDLINGYNTTPQWMAQMEEFHATMGALTMPWFPVAGNHDIYWRGEGRPPEEHEGRYEVHFGPLWYAFDHKGCTFIVLYTDEADPETGERNFNKPNSQRMSEEQLRWLKGALKDAKQSRHVFVFMHHPRWLGGKYGDDWERAHRLLAAAGNVTAVFAGHIHRMRYDGRRDGMEYFTLATVGGHLGAQLPRAGFMHQFHVVTVRDEGIALATLPVGTVIDPKSITGEVGDEVYRLEKKLTASITEPITIGAEGEVDAEVTFTIENPVDREVALTLTPMTGDRRFAFSPDHLHPTLEPGGTLEAKFRVTRRATAIDENFQVPELEIGADWLGEGLRVGVTPRRAPFRFLSPRLSASPRSREDRALLLDGRDDALILENKDFQLPDGPLTVEAWIFGHDYKGRRPLLAKTQSSEYGLFVDNGKPSFIIHLDGKYRSAAAAKPVLQPNKWHWVAGVYDEKEVRLYVDGELVGRAKASGKRRTNKHPFYIGSDPDSKGRPESLYSGLIDAVRISTVARYGQEKVKPCTTFKADKGTVLLLTMDHEHGPWILDQSSRGVHPRRLGGARLIKK